MNTKKRETVWTANRTLAAFVLLAAWFAIAYVIGTEGWLRNDAGSPLAPIALGAILPVALFVGLYATVPRFREFVLAQDLETLTLLQTWRVIGFGFLTLYAYGVLPGTFAFPAGIGDVAIGIMAVWVVLRLRRDPDFAKTDRFLWFNYAGLSDFAVAVVTAGLSAGAINLIVGDGPTSAPMDVWPLNLFPTFIVPLFIIAHLTVLLKVRHLRQADRGGAILQPAV